MTTYIVSGLERSGTSLMMQILENGNFPILYTNDRKADENNPKGYFELESGKIILKLVNNEFDPGDYGNKCIKITSYGLDYLPKGDYKVIYMDRDLREVLKSQNKMLKDRYKRSISDERMLGVLNKMNNLALDVLRGRIDIDYITVSYRNLMLNPVEEINMISKFLEFDISDGIKSIDESLWRNRYDRLDSNDNNN